MFNLKKYIYKYKQKIKKYNMKESLFLELEEIIGSSILPKFPHCGQPAGAAGRSASLPTLKIKAIPLSE